MTDIAPNHSIQQQPGDRPDLLIFEIVAKITEADIEWMAARVQTAFDTVETIDMLIIMRHFEGAELGAIFDAEAMKAQMRSLRHVRRYGVVGAPFWAKAMINLFSPLTPVEEKTFSLEEEAQARIWISAPHPVSP
ncbi:STAS/SEC14 domain-containing protein [Bosea sp. AAP35]|uniref:STAS/SEC14 domain-containing protein n=1 Tax=Bosea sp. AAP35 TaxID=1523417 RepID=UPI0006B89DB3|nr:STAS/SEC14 domain-containing protein [Bosea sp. AAP35]